MIEKQLKNVVEVRIVELEDKLMNVIEIANNYTDIPVPIFEQEIDEILAKAREAYEKKCLALEKIRMAQSKKYMRSPREILKGDDE